MTALITLAGPVPIIRPIRFVDDWRCTSVSGYLKSISESELYGPLLMTPNDSLVNEMITRRRVVGGEGRASLR